MKFRQITLVGKNGVGGILPLTRRDVFDFEVEDRFHYDIIDNNVFGKVKTGSSYERITILEKRTISNSVTYKVNSEKYLRRWVDYPEGTEETKNYIDKTYSITYDELDKLYSDLPGLLDSSRNVDYYMDSIGNNIGLSSLTKTHYRFKDSCYTAGGGLDVGLSDRQCGKGLGEWFHSATGFTVLDFESKKWLVYCSKGGNEWGSPVSVFNENRKSEGFKVYPNPSIGNFKIEGISPSLIEVYEISGRKVLEQTFDRNQTDKTEIDLSFLENGVYMLKAVSRHVQYSQLIQIQH